MGSIVSMIKVDWFVPDDQARQPYKRQIAYALMVPPSSFWAHLRRAIVDKGAIHHSIDGRFRVLRAGIAALLAGEASAALRRQYTAEIDAYIGYLRTLRGIAGNSAEGEFTNASALPGEAELIRNNLDLAASVNEIANRVRRGYAPFAEVEADCDFYFDVLCIEAARSFLTGWRGVTAYGEPVPFQRGSNGVSDDLLRYVPAAHLQAICNRAYDLRFPAETRRARAIWPSHNPSEIVEMMVIAS